MMGEINSDYQVPGPLGSPLLICFPTFGGLIRKANTDITAPYLRTIVADELEG